MKLVTAAEVTETVDASDEEVWHALTTPSILKKYFFGSDIKSTWKVGDPITFSGEYDGKKYQDKGSIRSSHPNAELSFTHWSALAGKPDVPENYHLVTIKLNQLGDGTRVTLRQDDQDGEPVDVKTRRQYEKNWSLVLKGLKNVVESPSD